jgi:hypothetical protein
MVKCSWHVIPPVVRPLAKLRRPDLPKEFTMTPVNKGLDRNRLGSISLFGRCTPIR